MRSRVKQTLTHLQFVVDYWLLQQNCPQKNCPRKMAKRTCLRKDLKSISLSLQYLCLSLFYSTLPDPPSFNHSDFTLYFLFFPASTFSLNVSPSFSLFRLSLFLYFYVFCLLLFFFSFSFFSSFPLLLLPLSLSLSLSFYLCRFDQ